MNKKVVLITGATSGIGEATAKLLAANGYNLIITGRRAARLKNLKADIENNFKGSDVLALNFDVRDRRSCEAAMNSLPEKFRKIDVLINNAGMASDLVRFQDGDPANWDCVIDTNIKGMAYMSKIVSEMMIREGRGHIVNIGSIAGTEPYDKGNIYCATKHAVHGFSSSIRIDLLGTGVKVTEIRPGKVNTEFSLVRFHGDREEAERVYNGYIPLVGDDVAETILWVIGRPSHVNINEIIIMPSDQANSYYLNKVDE